MPRTKKRIPPKIPKTTKRKNPVGFPPYYTNPEDMQILIDRYFETCDANNKPYTVVGLALSLGFCERKSLLDYAGKENFVTTIKKAKARIENQRNEQLIQDGNAAGKIFDLKNNFGWKDVTQQERSGIDGKPIETKAIMSLDEATRAYLDGLK